MEGGSKVVVSVILRLAAGVWPLRYRDPDALPLIRRARTSIIGAICPAPLTLFYWVAEMSVMDSACRSPPMERVERRLSCGLKLCTAPCTASGAQCMHDEAEEHDYTMNSFALMLFTVTHNISKQDNVLHNIATLDQ